MTFVSTAVQVLEGFGYTGSILKIIHLGAVKQGNETCCYPMPMDAEALSSKLLLSMKCGNKRGSNMQ